MEVNELAGLKAGGIYLLRYKRSFQSDTEAKLAQEHLDAIGERVGCRFVVIDGSLDLVQLPTSLVAPSRGDRKPLTLSYDAQSDWFVIDGVRVSPELLTSLITDPDPTTWIACERIGDAVTCRRQAMEPAVEA